MDTLLAIILTLIIVALPIAIYKIQFFNMLITKPYQPFDMDRYHFITVIIPTCNNETDIDKRITNICESYNPDFMEILVVDDASTDRTCETATAALKEHGLTGRVLVSPGQIGKNLSIDIGIQNASYGMVLITEPRGSFKKQSVVKMVSALVSNVNAGSVCGNVTPIGIPGKPLSAGIGGIYKYVYGKFHLWESTAQSTMCFNDGITLIRKDMHIKPKHDGRYATDTALNIIEHGFKCLYVPDAIYYKPMPLSKHLQKQLMITETMEIMTSLKRHHAMCSSLYGRFGRFVYPMRYAMFFICPFMLTAGLMTWLLTSMIISPQIGIISIVAIGLFVIMSKYKENLIMSMIWYQYYLIEGFLQGVGNKHFIR